MTTATGSSRRRRAPTPARLAAQSIVFFSLCAASCSSSDNVGIDADLDGGADAVAEHAAIDDASTVNDAGADVTTANTPDATSDGAKGGVATCARAVSNGPYDLPDGVCSIDGFCARTRPPYQRLDNALVLSATDVWAAGWGTVLHWDGSKWRGVTDLPMLQNAFGPVPVAGSSSTDIWFSGVLHWDGVKLTKVATPVTAISMWFAAPNDGWAVNYAPYAFHWNGVTWTPFPTSSGLRALLGFSSNDVLAAGATVIHWDGVAWTNQNTGVAKGEVVGGANTNDFWIGGSSLFHYVGGTSTSYAGISVKSISGNATDDVTIITGSNPNSVGDVLHWDGTALSTDVAATSQCAACGACTSVASAPDGTRVFTALAPVVTTNATCPVPGLSGDANVASKATARVVVYADTMLSLVSGKLYAGEQQEQPVVWGISPDDVAVDISGSAADDVWATGYSPTTNLASHFDGSSWSHAALPGKPISAVGATSPTNAWVLLAGRTAHWDGATWTDVAGSGMYSPRAVWGASATDAWVVGDLGGAHWDGALWTHVASLPNDMIQVRGASANDVIAIKAGGLLYHWDGIVWSLVPGSSVSSNLSVGDRPFAIVAPNDIWHAGGGPEIVQHWDGTCWRQLSAPDGRSPDDVVIGATSKKVFLVSAPTISRLDRAP